MTQLFLGLLLGTRRSAIGQFFFVPLATVPEGFAKANSTQSTSRFLSGEFVGLTKLLLKLHGMTCELNVHKEL